MLSVVEVAKKYEVTDRTVRRWIALGCPHETNVDGNYVFDLTRLSAWLDTRPKAGKKQLVDAKMVSDGSLSQELMAARVDKARADAELTNVKRQIATGALISLAEVKTAEIRRITRVRDGLLALVDTLPPRLAGLDIDGMRPVIREEVTRLLDEYARGRYGE